MKTLKKIVNLTIYFAMPIWLPLAAFIAAFRAFNRQDFSKVTESDKWFWEML